MGVRGAQDAAAQRCGWHGGVTRFSAALRRSIGELIVACLLTTGAWISAREALNRTFAASRPERVAALWPASGDALAELALKQIVAADGAPDDKGRALIAQALRRDPASAAPLTLAAFDAAANADMPRATRLMESARHRDPRLALARAWLFAEYARTGRTKAALAEAGPLTRLVPENRARVFAVVAELAARPGGGQALRATWARDPEWRAIYEQWLAERRSAAAP